MLLLSPLGPRLQSLFDIVEAAQRQVPRYDRVWDCCCDHGYLGLKILDAALCEKLIFVDQVPHIVQRLRTKLLPFPADSYGAIAGDAASLCFDPNKRHLVILAGVSGKTVISIMEAICSNHRCAQIDFLLCPTKSLYDVREYLISERFLLAHEAIVTEKRRHYEVIYIQSSKQLADRNEGDVGARSTVSATGAMWCGDNVEHRQYLAKLVAHYQRESQGEGRLRAKAIFRHYSNVLNQRQCAQPVGVTSAQCSRTVLEQ